MNISSADVRQEAVDLHRFIEPLIRMCTDLRADYPVFPEPSKTFFAYVQKLGLETQNFLTHYPDSYHKSKSPSTAFSKRQKLVLLRNAWGNLHEYLRPALDADSLHLPMPLITAFQDIVNEAEEWKQFEFVLFHTTQWNYLQVPSGMARDIANDIADLIGGSRFPINLGLVGIPYSQANSFFLNCLLPHEMAHFSYQEDSSAEVESEIDRALERMEQEIGTLGEEEISEWRDTLRRWVEETFCDLVALCQIGPAFTFAFAELTTAALIVGQPDGTPGDCYGFMSEHPAEAARFHVHLRLLKRLGWWEAISDLTSASISVLKSCENWSSCFYIQSFLPTQVSDLRVFECYNEIVDWLVDHVIQTVGSSVDHIEGFKKYSATISEYLRRAIVPSTIIYDGKQVNPHPVVLINAIWSFRLTELNYLIQNVEGESVDSVQSVSRMTDRLELWALKAIEDYRLLAKQAV